MENMTSKRDLRSVQKRNDQRKMTPEFLRGLDHYMKMNQVAQDWNNSSRYMRNPKKSIFKKPAYIVKEIKFGTTDRKIRFQIKYVPIWIKEQSYRIHTVRVLPTYKLMDGKAIEAYGKWLREHSKEPHINPLTVNSAVVLEEAHYTGRHLDYVRSFSTYNDMINAALLELNQQQFGRSLNVRG